MDDDSPGDREQGRTFWSGLRAFLLGDDSESTLRDEIEEAIENREGEAPRAGDLSAAERQMLKNILHFGEKTAGDVGGAARRHHRGAEHDRLRRAGRGAARGRAQPAAGL